jgi:hypothetical protein
MSTWIRITQEMYPITSKNKMIPQGVMLGVRGYIDVDDKSKGYWYEMLKVDGDRGFVTQSGKPWKGRVPVDFLELPYEPTPVEKFCDQFFPVIYEDVRSFARIEDNRKKAVQLVFNILAALEGEGVSVIYKGDKISGTIHGHWINWILKHHPEDNPTG